ncbi:serine phosphatase RsbU [Gracilibacillus boraciitolerans JCM 21714]|uniref:Serine phosphatase RsbU n=1 Tax=Gracilibacillus boraciitolerans JCM 21714 TaxID=1298598 RepID=W4VL03_9BACI|nr:Jag N-terminal domain-containing protein [Gracilibacillus boraciitolerans]GAE94065.1 serine phosphatase RsbU [Gracilibacillus boraciitolerans JCM 21714]
MNEFISKASTVEDAIDRGLHVMNISQKDVNIEVLQVNTKGFIGIGKKQAIVKLKRIKNTQQNIEKTTNSVPNLEKFVQEALNEYKETEELVKKPPMNTTVEEEKEGVAWIQNNELFVNSSHDKYATASIKEGITLYKNEEKITKQTILLSKDDEYRVEYEEFYEKPMSWKISIIKNEIEAILDVYPGEKISRNLKDVAPSEHITIELQSQKEPVNTLSKADILAELDNKNIIFGLNHTAIENALETKEQVDLS